MQDTYCLAKARPATVVMKLSLANIHKEHNRRVTFKEKLQAVTWKRSKENCQ